MNIFKKEIKTHIKPLIGCAFGITLLLLCGMLEFDGLNSMDAAAMGDMLSSIPKELLAIIGMVDGVNVTTLSGYYSILTNFVFIIISIYAISLGLIAVNRELVDKTYEFLFTKPVSRKVIHTIKMLSCYVPLVFLCLYNYLITIIIISNVDGGNAILNEVLYASISVFIIASLFFSISVLIATIFKKTEKASMIANMIFMICFVIGILVDILENSNILRLFAPLRYFNYNDIVNNELNILYIIISITIIFISIICSYFIFSKKDLT